LTEFSGHLADKGGTTLSRPIRPSLKCGWTVMDGYTGTSWVNTYIVINDTQEL